MRSGNQDRLTSWSSRRCLTLIESELVGSTSSSPPPPYNCGFKLYFDIGQGHVMYLYIHVSQGYLCLTEMTQFCNLFLEWTDSTAGGLGLHDGPLMPLWQPKFGRKQPSFMAIILGSKFSWGVGNFGQNRKLPYLRGLYIHSMELVWTSECNTNSTCSVRLYGVSNGHKEKVFPLKSSQ